MSKSATDVADKEIIHVVRLAEEQGWNVTPVGTRLKFTPADKSQGVIFVSHKQSGKGRGYANDIARLKRAGLKTDDDDKDIDLAAEELRDIVVEGMEMFEPGALDVIAEAAKEIKGGQRPIETFVATVVMALGQWDRAVGNADKDAKEQIKIDELETQLLDLMAEKETLEARCTRLEQQVSNLGAEVVAANKQSHEYMEQANKYKQRLAAFRQALIEED